MGPWPQQGCRERPGCVRWPGTGPGWISFIVTVRVAHAQSSVQVAAAGDTLHGARREAIIDLLADLLPKRRDRQCERVKKPSRNTFATTKRDHTRPASQVTYKFKVTRRLPSPAQTP